MCTHAGPSQGGAKNKAELSVRKGRKETPHRNKLNCLNTNTPAPGKGPQAEVLFSKSRVVFTQLSNSTKGPLDPKEGFSL